MKIVTLMVAAFTLCLILLIGKDVNQNNAVLTGFIWLGTIVSLIISQIAMK